MQTLERLKWSKELWISSLFTHNYSGYSSMVLCKVSDASRLKHPIYCLSYPKRKPTQFLNYITWK